MTRSKKSNTASTQAVDDRDNRGRFKKGNKPKSTFKDHPENRYDITKDGNFNPQHSPRHQLRKLWTLPKSEVKKRIMSVETNTNISYGEYLALLQANRARHSTRDFVDTMNQAEGSPIQPVDMEIHDDRKKSPYDELTIEQLRKLLGE